MSLKEIFQQVKQHATPVQWSVFGFNLSFLAAYIIAIMCIGGISAIILNQNIVTNNILPILWFIIFILSIGAILLVATNSVFTILQHIITTKENQDISFKSLWKNTLKLKWSRVKFTLCFTLVGLVIGLLFILMVGPTAASNKSPDLPTPVMIAFTVFGVIINLLLVPAFLTALPKAILEETASFKCMLYGFKTTLRHFLTLVLIPVCIIFIPALLISLGTMGENNTPTALGNILEFIYYLIIIFLEPYFLSYYLVNYYKNNPPPNTTSSVLNDQF